MVGVVVLAGCTADPGPASDSSTSSGIASVDEGSAEGSSAAASTGIAPTGPGPSDDTADTTTTSPPDDGSTTEAPPADPCGGADILCDDFEADALDGQWAFVGNPNNMPTIDAAVARSGTRSLTFAATDTQGAFVYPVLGLPTDDNVVHVRAFVRFAQATAQMGGHVSFIVGADQPSNGAEMRLGASQNFGNGMMMLDVNLLGMGPEYTQFSNGDVTGGASSGARGVALDADSWYCFEARFDGAGHEFRVWLDGAELTAMHVTDWAQGVSDWSPSYSVIKLGGQNYSGSLGQVWFDDVAIGHEPIGCP